MSFLDLNLDDAHLDPVTLKEGEYRLRVAAVEESVSKNGNPMLTVRFECLDSPDAEAVFYHFNLPVESTEPRTARFFRQQLRNFVLAFLIPLDKKGGLDTNTVVGCTGNAIVAEEAYQGVTRNVIKSFTKGR